MDFVDRELTCIDCGADFVFTAGEQLFFHDKQFTNDRNTASCVRENAPVERKERVPKRAQPALSVAWKQPFPSSQRRADPCFVAHVFRKWRDSRRPVVGYFEGEGITPRSSRPKMPQKRKSTQSMLTPLSDLDFPTL